MHHYVANIVLDYIKRVTGMKTDELETIMLIRHNITIKTINNNI